MTPDQREHARIIFLISVGSGSFYLGGDRVSSSLSDILGWGLVVIGAFILIYAGYEITKEKTAFIEKAIKWIKNIRLQWPWPFYKADKPHLRGVSLENLVHVFDVEIEYRELESMGHLKFILHGYNATPYALKFRSEDSRIGLFQAEFGGVVLGPFALEPITKQPVPPYSEFMLRLIQGIPKDSKKGILEFIKDYQNSKNVAPPNFSLEKVKIIADVEGKKKASFPVKMNDRCYVGLKHRKATVGTTCIRRLHPKNLNVQPKITIAKNE